MPPAVNLPPAPVLSTLVVPANKLTEAEGALILKTVNSPDYIIHLAPIQIYARLLARASTNGIGFHHLPGPGRDRADRRPPPGQVTDMQEPGTGRHSTGAGHHQATRPGQGHVLRSLHARTQGPEPEVITRTRGVVQDPQIRTGLFGAVLLHPRRREFVAGFVDWCKACTPPQMCTTASLSARP